MAKQKQEKTNVMRILEQSKILYTTHCYKDSGAISGIDVAKVMGQNPSQVFKTLVTTGKSGEHYVFVVPSDAELDLKKAAKVSGEKSIEMLKQKELLGLTGYIHGGCSPIGMKKFFNTYVDDSVLDFETFIISAGKIGYQVEVTFEGLKNIIDVKSADLIR